MPDLGNIDKTDGHCGKRLSRPMQIPGESSGPPPFEVAAPEMQRIPVVFNSPHSGRHYPAAFLAASRLDPQSIRRSEDCHVDELFAAAVGFGAPFLKANFPRAWLDVNREPYELDPTMFKGTLPSYANVRSIRVAGGLGTIARIVSESEEIYSAPLPVEEGLARIDAIYKPYHQALRDLLLATHQRFGFAVLIDCHSMPSSIRGGSSRTRPDIVLGDRYGTSCAGELTDAVAHGLTRLGYSVSRNKPYAGGFITEHYGQPGRGLHAMQIEINRGLYMDEASQCKSNGFTRLASDLRQFMAALSREFAAGLLVRADAAE